MKTWDKLVGNPWQPIGLILFLATGLYLYQLGTESLWIDEFLSIHKNETGANLPPGNLERPFYFLILYAWMQLSTSITWLRGLSVIFGLLSIFLIYLLGRKLAGEKIGLISALLLTLSPLFINHAQEVRMYTLIPCLSLAGTLGLAHALEKPTARALNGWTLMRLLTLFTTPLTVLLFVPDVIIICQRFYRQRRHLIACGIRLLFIVSAWLPSVAAVHQASTEMQGENAHYIKPNLIFIVGQITHLTAFWPLKHLLGSGISAKVVMAKLEQKPVLNWFWQDIIGNNALSMVYYMAYTLMLIALVAIAVGSRATNPKILWLKLWALLPVALILVMSYTFSPIWKARYLLLASPYWLILLAVGFIQLWRWRSRFALTVAAIYGIAVMGGLGHYYTTLYRTFHGSPF